MKKLILSFSLLLLSVCFAKSQPTITSANLPVIGDVYVSQNASTVPSEGSAGANQTWDFSTLTPNGAQTSQTFVSPASTPYAGTFPFSNLASTDGSGAYAYYLSSASDLQVVGAAIPILQYPFTDYQKYFVYPCTYNTTFNDNTSANWILNTVPTARTGSVSFKADGYGTLKLPSGVIANTLRVKYVEDLTDVFTIGVTFTINYHYTIYAWYAAGTKSPLMTISHDTTITNGVPQVMDFASYYPLNVAVQELEPTAELLNAFPIPASVRSTLSFTLVEPGDISFTLVNAIGQTVRSWTEGSLSAGIHSEEIDLGDLENGVYFVRLEMMNRKAVTLRLIKD